MCPDWLPFHPYQFVLAMCVCVCVCVALRAPYGVRSVQSLATATTDLKFNLNF